MGGTDKRRARQTDGKSDKGGQVDARRTGMTDGKRDKNGREDEKDWKCSRKERQIRTIGLYDKRAKIEKGQGKKEACPQTLLDIPQ